MLKCAKTTCDDFPLNLILYKFRNLLHSFSGGDECNINTLVIE